MDRSRVFLGLTAAAALVALPACGPRFPFFEKATPFTYGPPFGSDLYRPEHPHPKASSERHAQTLEETERFESHARCNEYMRRVLAEHPAGASGPVAISPIETVGHYTQGQVIEELRCTSYTLTRRSWIAAGHGTEHGAAH